MLQLKVGASGRRHENSTRGKNNNNNNRKESGECWSGGRVESLAYAKHGWRCVNTSGTQRNIFIHVQRGGGESQRVFAHDFGTANRWTVSQVIPVGTAPPTAHLMNATLLRREFGGRHFPPGLNSPHTTRLTRSFPGLYLHRGKGKKEKRK